MSLAVLTPFDTKPAQRDGGGRVWWKRILPIGEIDYKGRKLKFTRKYLDDLAEAYNDQAYDQVPFQLADAHNTHTNDPERFRGEFDRAEVRSDGLWMGMRPTPEGDKLLMTNPRLGVSARIVEAYQRADGKFYPAAIQHVLGTLDPRIPQLGPWQAVEMSNDADQVLDLSGESFTGEEGGTVPDLTATQQARLDRLLALSDEQFEAFLATIGVEGDLGDGDDGEELSDEELAALVDELDDEELAALEAEAEKELLAGAGTSLSNGGRDAVELANIQLAEQERQIGLLREESDKRQYELEKAKLSKKLPPYLIEMARPLLEGTGHVVELSNGRGVDAGLIMRRVLNEVAAVTGMLELDVELGTTMDEPDDSQNAVASRSAIVQRYRSQTGL